MTGTGTDPITIADPIYTVLKIPLRNAHPDDTLPDGPDSRPTALPPKMVETGWMGGAEARAA